MITAEEFLDSRYPEFNHLDSGNIWVNIENLMIDFAKLHVEAALKEANEKVYLSTYSGENKGKTALGSGNNGNHPIVEIDKDSILNAYPLTNIK